MDFMGTPGKVRCCLCGVPMSPNPSNMCVSCISTQIDVTEDIQKEITILHCQSCDSYFHPPKQWLKASLESRELLAFCLKKIKGLSKVKLVDAEFLWTEPHSKRIKVKVTVQKEFSGAIIQGSCVVLYVVQNNMCPDCNRRRSNSDVWTACVQVRQHVPHKRTFFYLEQLILKHKAHENATNVKSMHEGIDFYFATRAGAQKFVDFLQAAVPVKSRHDRSLVSHDTKSNTFNYKYSFSVEIVPICKVETVCAFGSTQCCALKDDLVCLPPKASHHYGAIGPLVMCSRVTNSLQFVDPVTMKSFYMDAPTYWRYGFKNVRSSRQLVSFIVLDIEPITNTPGRFCLADATVARESDFGTSDQTYFVRTTLGHILKPGRLRSYPLQTEIYLKSVRTAGDTALGYDLINANLVDPDLEIYINRGYTVPDVVLVKKSYEHTRKKRQNKGFVRNWKVAELDMEIDETGRCKENTRDDTDRELFYQDIEEDKELQSQIALYRNPDGRDGSGDGAMEVDSDEDDDEIDVALESLVDKADVDAL